MRVIVCGGRDFKYETTLCAALDRFHASTPISLLIHGGASGADKLAGFWAKRSGVPVKVFPPDWLQHGPSAGPRRNRQMLDEGKPDCVIAFPGGKGTADMCRRAEAAGVTVVRL